LAQGDPQGVIAWAADHCRRHRGWKGQKGDKGDEGEDGQDGLTDWHLPYQCRTGNANYTLTDADIGMVDFLYAGSATTYTITLPTPVEGAWFDMHIRYDVGVGGGTTIYVDDDLGNHLLDWTNSPWPVAYHHIWVTFRPFVVAGGVIQWAAAQERVWTGDTPTAI